MKAPGTDIADIAGIFVVIVVLAAANLVAHFGPAPVDGFAVPVAALLLVAFARYRKMSWATMGLAVRDWGKGARYGAVAAWITVVVVAAGLALPLTRTAFMTERYDVGWAPVLVAALVVIPLQTVIPEELAFRGVLLGALGRRCGARRAALGSSILFGLWHVAPSLNLTGTNRGFADSLGTGVAGQVLAVLGVVVATTVAGLIFCRLRQRSGSVLAPIGLHWALNSVGALAAATAWRLSGG